jgi:hypothetical protein
LQFGRCTGAVPGGGAGEERVLSQFELPFWADSGRSATAARSQFNRRPLEKGLGLPKEPFIGPSISVVALKPNQCVPVGIVTALKVVGNTVTITIIQNQYLSSF